MKTTTPKKKPNMTLVVPAPKSRLRAPKQRSAVFKSGKEYNRRAGKRVED